MYIKKLSHCCLVIETKGKKILLDPGYFSLEEHRKLKKLDIILITHEHSDHFHIESLKELLKTNPKAKIITNDVVGDMLAKEGIEHHIMKHGNVIDLEEIHIEAYGKDHAIMHSSIPPVSNVGFFIENKFFFPGDALTDPEKEIGVLGLPVSGPWMKISEAVDYALKLRPRIAIPMHDAIKFGSAHMIPSIVLPKNGIEFIKLEEGGDITL